MTAHKTQWYHLEMFSDFEFGFCPSKIAWNETRKEIEWELEYPSEDGGAATSRKGRRARIVLVTVGPRHSPRDVVQYLAHEATHVWRHFASYIGEKKPSSEFQCYITAFILDKLIEGYEKTRGPLIRGKRNAR